MDEIQRALRRRARRTPHVRPLMISPQPMDQSMRQSHHLFFLLGLTFLLAACQGTATGVATSLPPSPTAPSPSPTAVPTDATRPATAAATATTATAACSVVGSITPAPLENSPFPPVGPDDWVQGSQDATVTIVEYGDFQ